LSDQTAYTKATKQHRSLGEIVEKYRQWKTLHEELAGARDLYETADDEEMREMARLEIESLRAQEEQREADLRLLLIPTDPNDEKTSYSKFAPEQAATKPRFCRRNAAHVPALRRTPALAHGNLGRFGFRRRRHHEAVALIEGDKVYSKLKHESGTHRVQRVPQTEASGRIHTSAITVAVLPEAEEVDVKIDQKDLRIDTFVLQGRAANPSTRHTAPCASRISRPTQSSRCRTRNRKSKPRKAMRVLRARLQELEEQKQHDAEASERRTMVGSGDRSEKSAPTTSRIIASQTTASASPFTNSISSWKARSMNLSAPSSHTIKPKTKAETVAA
jgi:peptide chain release factor 1